MVNHANFRFYEELNDFLPLDKKKVPFVYPFGGNPSIKDALEAIGVPHVEVDLMRVNDQVVDFNYHLKNNDRVSVYPVLKTQKKASKEIKFVLDVHLGKLAKYLRMCGFDSAYENDYDNSKIVRISVEENRIILTRDIGMLKMKAVSQGYFIRNQDSKAQLAEVLNHFDLHQAIDPFKRCIKCNGKLERVEKEKVMQQLQPLTQKHFDTFFKCESCQSIYWEGSHFDRMNSFINTIKNSGSP